METLREFSHYSVVSEKIDKCPWKYVDIIDGWAFIIGVVSIIGIVASANIRDIYSCVCFISLFFITLSIGICLSDCWYSCGSIIKLSDNNYKHYYLKEISYQFTDNSDYDAVEIKTIIDGFEVYANKIDAENKKQDEEQLKSQKECCNKYKSVIRKVK